VKAQLGVPDMKLPIQWGLLGAQRMTGDAPHLDLLSMGTLTFEKPDDARFPSIKLAREAMKLGGTAPAALNAANEVAVEAFLEGRTNFYGVTSCVQHVLERHENCARPALDDVLNADSIARHQAREWINSYDRTS
jgi:1-deoxy-D-xylulose-5-phosphate reductoisomerase